MAENKVVNLEVKEKGMEEMGQKTLSLKAKLKELKEQMALAGDGTAEFKRLAAEAGALQDRIGDVNRQVKNLSSDTSRLDLGLEAVQGVAGGFAAAQGAMSLFGDESEEMQKSMMKVMGAMSLVNGVQQVAKVLNKDAVLGTKLRIFWNETLVGSFKKASMAQKAFMATGIGLLLTGIATLVAYWDDIAATVSGVSDEQTKLNAKTDANVLAQKAKYDAISGQDNILKLQGKSEQDILKIKKAQINAVIKATEAQLVQQESTKKAQVAAAKRNRDILQGIIRFITAPLTLLLGTIDMVGKALGKDFGLEKSFSGGIAKMVFDPEEVAEKADKTIDETKKQLSKLKNEAAGFEIDLQQQSDKASKTEKDKTKSDNDIIAKANAEAKKLALEQQQQLDAKLEEIANQNYLNTLSDQEKELLAVQDKYFELETLAKGNAESLNDIEIAKLNEQNDINLKYQDIAYKQDQEFKAKQKEADEKAAKEKIDTEKAVADAKIAIQQQGLDTALQGINLIKGLFEKSKGIQKAALIAESAIGIAKMIISNKASNSATTLKYAALPGGVALAASEIAFNNISTGIGIAANITATGKALKALGGGSVSPPPSTGGGGGSAGGQAPSFNVVGNSGINQLAQLQQQPMQAYVVSGSVTTAQSLDRNRIENATL